MFMFAVVIGYETLLYHFKSRRVLVLRTSTLSDFTERSLVFVRLTSTPRSNPKIQKLGLITVFAHNFGMKKRNNLPVVLSFILDSGDSERNETSS